MDSIVRRRPRRVCSCTHNATLAGTTPTSSRHADPTRGSPCHQGRLHSTHAISYATVSQRVVDARRTDDLQQAPVYAGESVGLVTGERSATDVVRQLTADAEKALRDAARLVG